MLSSNDLAAANELSTKTSRPFYASDGWVELSSEGKVVSEKPFYKFANGSQTTESKIFDEVSGASARKLILGIATDTDITKLRTDLKTVLETQSIQGGTKVNDLDLTNILK